MNIEYSNAIEKPAISLKQWVLPIFLILVFAGLISIPDKLEMQAKVSLLIFTATIILWATTKINAGYIAIVAMLAMVLCGVSEQQKLYHSMASDVIWLMIGAFILGGAVQVTGLAARITTFIVSKAQTVRGVFWLLTTVLIPLSLVIPSTSGRAALMIPVFKSISDTVSDKKINKVLALLIPTIILVSTITSLIAAGSHLIAIDLLNRMTGRTISYTQWLLYGLPFGVVASYLSSLILQYMLLSKAQRVKKLRFDSPKKEEKMSKNEKQTLFVILIMIGLWFTESLHGLEIATVTVLGALILTLPGKFGVLSWKKALHSVSWNLIIFVSASIVMGEALIETGAAQWIMDHAFNISGVLNGASEIYLLFFLALITLTSHIYINSHSARAVAMVPALLLLATSLQINPLAVLFIGITGMNFCQTFPVSSKALLMFFELENETYKTQDLMKSSLVLMALHLVLIFIFYFTYWDWVGLTF